MMPSSSRGVKQAMKGTSMTEHTTVIAMMTFQIWENCDEG